MKRIQRRLLSNPRIIQRNSSDTVSIIECPRDAIQGVHKFIPTGLKQRYINSLLRCGFHTIDFGSFVGPAVPQMRDTSEVLKGLDMSNTKSKLLAIVATVRGAAHAVQHPEVSLIGYPLSINETFQQSNTKRNIAKAIEDLKTIQELCVLHNRTLVIYLSMAFGNPYGDPYNEDVIDEFVNKLDQSIAPKIITPADTVGTSEPDLIRRVYKRIIPRYPHIEFGAHFHSVPLSSMEKIEAAYDAGVRRFDGALGGMGGCPFARKTLTGNVPTEAILSFLESKGVSTNVNKDAIAHAEDIRILAFSVPMRELVLAAVLGDESRFRRMCRTHFDVADKTKKGYLDFEEFQEVMLQVYQELDEEIPSLTKLRNQYEKHQKNGRIYFDEYYSGAKQGLQRRLGKLQSNA